MVVLYERSRDAVGAVPFGMVRLEEEATMVAVHIGLDDQHLGQGGGRDTH
jgi:hypothetical protein